MGRIFVWARDNPPMSQNKMSEKKRNYAVGRGKTANTTRSALIAAAELAAAHRLGIWDSVMLA